MCGSTAPRYVPQLSNIFSFISSLAFFSIFFSFCARPKDFLLDHIHSILGLELLWICFIVLYQLKLRETLQKPELWSEHSLPFHSFFLSATLFACLYDYQ